MRALLVDVLGIEGRVVEQNLDAVRPSFFQPASRPVIKQVAQAAGTGLVVSGLFIGQQQAGIFGATLGRGQAPLGIEQDRAGMRSENFGDQRLEFFHQCVADFATFFLSQRLLQRPPLVHSSRADYALGGGDSFEA